jgi:hypothetical protein
MNTGFKELSWSRNVKQQFGFSVIRFDTSSVFDVVKSNGRLFPKGEPNLNVIEIAGECCGQGARCRRVLENCRTLSSRSTRCMRLTEGVACAIVSDDCAGRESSPGGDVSF